MIPDDMQVIGIKDMTKMQLEALTKVIGHAVILSQDCGCPDIAEEVLADANELVELLGGVGVAVTRNVDFQL